MFNYIWCKKKLFTQDIEIILEEMPAEITSLRRIRGSRVVRMWMTRMIQLLIVGPRIYLKRRKNLLWRNVQRGKWSLRVAAFNLRKSMHSRWPVTVLVGISLFFSFVMTVIPPFLRTTWTKLNHLLSDMA